MRRSLWVCLGALVFCVTTGAAGVMAADEPSSTDSSVPTTSTPSTAPNQTTSTTVAHPPSTTTTAKPAPTTSTTKPKSTAPVPPPASGAQQPLVQDLVGTPVIETTTTVAPPPSTTSTTTTTTQLATPISAHTDPPRPATLVLATVAWLASLGGLLVYAEDKRSTKWKHLAR